VFYEYEYIFDVDSGTFSLAFLEAVVAATALQEALGGKDRILATREALIAFDAPKEAFAEATGASQAAVLRCDIAKVLNMGLGQKKFKREEKKMENQLFKFENQEVRTTIDEEKIWFVASDVCKCLGLENVSMSLERVEKDDISTTDVIDSIGRKQMTTIVTESGVYTLVFQSRKEEAVKFQRWVTHDVLPSIRKHGIYATDNLIDKMLADPDYGIKVYQTLKEERQKRIASEQKIKELEPKAEFYDAVAGSKDAISMLEVSKVLCVGRNTLFQILRDQKILMQDNLPYQTYIDKEWFRVIEQKWQGKDGEPNIGFKTLVFQKGVEAIKNIVRGRKIND
jgi:prophage antirepressor-like protein